MQSDNGDIPIHTILLIRMTPEQATRPALSILSAHFSPTLSTGRDCTWLIRVGDNFAHLFGQFSYLDDQILGGRRYTIFRPRVNTPFKPLAASSKTSMFFLLFMMRIVPVSVANIPNIWSGYDMASCRLVYDSLRLHAYIIVSWVTSYLAVRTCFYSLLQLSNFANHSALPVHFFMYSWC